MTNLLRENNVHILAIENVAGIPQDSDTLNPSAHLSVDADGNLRVSATAIIPGSVEISNDVGNPVPVSGTVEITNDVGNPIPVNGTVTANAGVGPWPVTDNGGSLTVDGPLTDVELRATPVPISAATLPLPTGAATSALQTQPGVDIGDVTINNGAGAGSVNIQDGGNSITVDGPLTDVELRATPVPISAATLPLPTGAATAALQTQPGVDIGDVTVNNGAGASAVNIQDGGNSITVDGAVTTTPTNATTVPTQFTKTVALTTVPEALAANGTFFKTATIIARKAPRTLNTGNVYLGVEAADDTQPIELQPGDIYGIAAPDGQQYDLNDWYLDVATVADGVVVIYS